MNEAPKPITDSNEHAKTLDFAEANFGLESASELRTASQTISSGELEKEVPVAPKQAQDNGYKIKKIWKVREGHFAILYENGGRGDMYPVVHREPTPEEKEEMRKAEERRRIEVEKAERRIKLAKNIVGSHDIVMCVVAILLLLTRPLEIPSFDDTRSAEAFYRVVRYAVSAIGLWQAVRLFRAKRAFYLGALLCVAPFALNPFVDVKLPSDLYAAIYAWLTVPFVVAVVCELVHIVGQNDEKQEAQDG